MSTYNVMDVPPSLTRLAGSIKSPVLCRKINGLLFDELHPTVLRLASIRVI